MDKLLLTTEEAADLLGISRWKVYELIRVGVLKSVKLGGSRRISSSVLAEFVANLADGNVA